MDRNFYDLKKWSCKTGPFFFELFEVLLSFVITNLALMISHLNPEYRKRYCPIVLLIILLCILFSCKPEKTNYKGPVFQKLSSGKTNVTFQNTLTETDTFNYFLVFLHVYGRWGFRWRL